VRIAFIAWTHYQRRTELIAQHLGATLHFICYGQEGKVFQAPLRYMVQAWRTWCVLCQERPDIVFVQNPPIFSVLLCSFYVCLYHSQYVIDSHTGAFLSSNWRWSLPLHRMLSRKALVTIVHNKSQEKIIKDWGCRSYVLIDPVSDYPIGEVFTFHGDFSVVVVSSFKDDEPIDIVFEAACRLNGVSFYFTGEPDRLDPYLLMRKPGNCHLTGYLPYEQYVGLLRGADAIMVLTTRDQTLLSGAFEAVSLQKPLILSDWPILRDYFTTGTVYVPNTIEGIQEGIQRAQCEQVELQKGIVHLHQQLHDRWKKGYKELRELLLNQQVIIKKQY
jgi:glycosyltransferase involved in cell wall biosynthesis